MHRQINSELHMNLRSQRSPNPWSPQPWTVSHAYRFLIHFWILFLPQSRLISPPSVLFITGHRWCLFSLSSFVKSSEKRSPLLCRKTLFLAVFHIASLCRREMNRVALGRLGAVSPPRWATSMASGSFSLSDASTSYHTFMYFKADSSLLCMVFNADNLLILVFYFWRFPPFSQLHRFWSR